MKQQPPREPAVKDIESPTGLDLHPAPPEAVRLSKRAGILGLMVVTAVVALVGYGVVTRRERAVQMAHPDDNRNLTAATEAGKSIAAQVPARVIAGSRSGFEEGPSSESREQNELKPPTQAHHDGEDAAPPARWQQHAPYNPPPAVQYREPSPEEKWLEQIRQQEMDARSAPTSTRGEFGGIRSAQPAVPTREGDMTQMTELLQAMQGPRAQAATSAAPGASALARLGLNRGGDGEGDGFAEQNMQEQKESFLLKTRAGGTEDYLKSTRVKPLSRYEIKAGWDIPAILEQALNSDLPGEVRALVRENVYDTATGRYVLIPQGSRVVGVYDSKISYGQSGMMVVWNRIVCPDGSTVNLEGMAGQDAKGQSGLRDKVDRHYTRLIGFALLTSGFGAAFQLSQSRRDNSVLSYPSPAEIAGSAVSRELSQIGSQITRRNLNVQPTIKVPIGYRFNVRVNRDILFEGPYRPFPM